MESEHVWRSECLFRGNKLGNRLVRDQNLNARTDCLWFLGAVRRAKVRGEDFNLVIETKGRIHYLSLCTACVA